MSAAPWKAILAIAIGSLIGTLARHGLILAIGTTQSARLQLAVVVSALGGMALGAAIGWVATVATLKDDRRQLAMISRLMRWLRER